MPTLHVCSLSRLHETVAEPRASHLVTLISEGTPVERPAAIAADRHLHLSLHDITEPLEGHVHPAEHHVETLLDFVRAWDRERPLVIHCWAGISRSTAGAFITACALGPGRRERDIALALRAASPIATPNRRLVEIADGLLAREGRMSEAVRIIGRGADAMEGSPFRLDLD